MCLLQVWFLQGLVGKRERPVAMGPHLSSVALFPYLFLNTPAALVTLACWWVFREVALQFFFFSPLVVLGHLRCLLLPLTLFYFLQFLWPVLFPALSNWLSFPAARPCIASNLVYFQRPSQSHRSLDKRPLSLSVQVPLPIPPPTNLTQAFTQYSAHLSVETILPDPSFTRSHIWSIHLCIAL